MGDNEKKGSMTDEYNTRKSLLLSEDTRKMFKLIFNRDIREFFSKILLSVGMIDFDIVAFDEWLGVPEDMSTKEYLIEKYSPEVAKFIESLL